MNIWILIGIISVSLILVIIAFIIITKKSKNQKTSIKKTTTPIKKLDFEDLMLIAKNPKTSSDKLLETLKLFNKNFIIENKNEQKYFVFFSRILSHKNVNKEIFRYFHKEIKNNNLNYKRELEIIEKKILG